MKRQRQSAPRKGERKGDEWIAKGLERCWLFVRSDVLVSQAIFICAETQALHHRKKSTEWLKCGVIHNILPRNGFSFILLFSPTPSSRVSRSPFLSILLSGLCPRRQKYRNKGKRRFYCCYSFTSLVVRSQETFCCKLSQDAMSFHRRRKLCFTSLCKFVYLSLKRRRKRRENFLFHSSL